MKPTEEISQAGKASGMGLLCRGRPAFRHFPCLLILSVLVTGLGCRAHPFAPAVSFFDAREAKLVSERWTEKIVGATLEEADEFLPPRNDTLLQEDRIIGAIYPSPRNAKGETFLVCDVGDDQKILRMSIWKRNRDGLGDLFTARTMAGRAYSLSQLECEEKFDLRAPTAQFVSKRTGFDVVVYAIDERFWPQGEKLVLFCFGPYGLCSDVRIIGLTAGFLSRLNKEESAVLHNLVPADENPDLQSSGDPGT